jgi:hypothetical protein
MRTRWLLSIVVVSGVAAAKPAASDPVAVRVVGPGGAPVETATVRFPVEGDHHRVDAAGRWAGSELYLADGSVMPLEPDSTVAISVGAPGYAPTTVLYTIPRTRGAEVEVAVTPLDLRAYVGTPQVAPSRAERAALPPILGADPSAVQAFALRLCAPHGDYHAELLAWSQAAIDAPAGAVKPEVADMLHGFRAVSAHLRWKFLDERELALAAGGVITDADHVAAGEAQRDAFLEARAWLAETPGGNTLPLALCAAAAWDPADCAAP